MKTILLSTSVLMLAAQLATAATYFLIGITHEGTNTVYSVQDKPTPIEEVREYAARIGTIATDLMVLVRVDPSTPSKDLLSVIKLIKDAGLQNVCILPGRENSGFDLLSINIMANTNDFTETYFKELISVDELLDNVPPPTEAE